VIQDPLHPWDAFTLDVEILEPPPDEMAAVAVVLLSETAHRVLDDPIHARRTGQAAAPKGDARPIDGF
jgi:hypothetical protein